MNSDSECYSMWLHKTLGPESNKIGQTYYNYSKINITHAVCSHNLLIKIDCDNYRRRHQFKFCLQMNACSEKTSNRLLGNYFDRVKIINCDLINLSRYRRDLKQYLIINYIMFVFDSKYIILLPQNRKYTRMVL